MDENLQRMQRALIQAQADRAVDEAIRKYEAEAALERVYPIAQTPPTEPHDLYLLGNGRGETSMGLGPYWPHAVIRVEQVPPGTREWHYILPRPIPFSVLDDHPPTAIPIETEIAYLKQWRINTATWAYSWWVGFIPATKTYLLWAAEPLLVNPFQHERAQPKPERPARIVVKGMGVDGGVYPAPVGE